MPFSKDECLSEHFGVQIVNPLPFQWGARQECPQNCVGPISNIVVTTLLFKFVICFKERIQGLPLVREGRIGASREAVVCRLIKESVRTPQ